MREHRAESADGAFTSAPCGRIGWPGRRAVLTGPVFGLMLALASMTGPDARAAGKREIVVTDMGGRTVRVPQGPRRVVCLGPGSLRQVCYLGAADRVVGVERLEKDFPHGRPYRLAYPELADLPVVGPGGPAGINAEPDLEALLQVRPQVVFVSYMDPERADAMQRKIGIPVVLLSMGRFATFDERVYDSLQLAGRVLDTEDRAREIVRFLEEAQRDLAARSAGDGAKPGPLVYVGGIGFKGTQGIESSDADYIPFRWLGERSLAQEFCAEGHCSLDREILLQRDPEVIFVDAGGLSRVRADRERKPEFYRGLSAFRDGKVHVLHPYNWYVTNLETAVADAYAAGKILHPEGFADVDPQKKASEIVRFFVGKPVHGAMVDTYGPLGEALDPASGP